MDGYSSHITVNFITYCIKHTINLFILLPHISHLLQPFNVNMFAPLKHTLTEKTDAIFKHNFKHISQIN